MADIDYTYAVARIRALETWLFSASVIEQLMACKTYESCLSLLQEKGWGESGVTRSGEHILIHEREKIWETMRELKVDMHIFDVLSYPNLFHNLKAAIKEVCTQEVNANIFYRDCEIGQDEMMRIIRQKDYMALPKFMREAAQEAYEAMLHSRDGQLCDVIVDTAALEAIMKAGKESELDIIRQYAESMVAVADIKVAVRCAATGKSVDFMKRAMVKCDSLDVNALAVAASKGMAGICEYLTVTEYKEGAEALKESPSAFERWCDNRIIRTIQPQRYQPFTAGPLFAYVIARENEIKTVRIILTGKQNDLPEDSIRERIREMYV